MSAKKNELTRDKSKLDPVAMIQNDVNESGDSKVGTELGVNEINKRMKRHKPVRFKDYAL